MNKISITTINKCSFILFLVSIFLFRLPNFYLLPFIRNSFLTSQAISRILSGLVFLLNFSLYFVNKKRNIKPIIPNSITASLVLLLFLIETISIISAINIAAYFERYKDIVVGIIFFLNGYVYKNKIKTIYYVLLITLPINIFYELSMYFIPEVLIKFGSIFIYEKHFNLVLFNISRGRTYIETFNEILLPFLFYMLNSNSLGKHTKIISYILISLTLFCSYLSNWRIRVIMALFGCIISLVCFHKKNVKVIFFTITSIIFFGFIVNNISIRFVNLSFISRFIDDNVIKNTSSLATLDFRKEQILNAFELSKKSPLGVGLGNYYDNLSNNFKQQDIIQGNSEDSSALLFVHNIFGSILVETGIVGFVVFTLLILCWGIFDFIKLRLSSAEAKVPILSFWILFLFALFNPVNIGAFQVLFLLLRGLII